MEVACASAQLLTFPNFFSFSMSQQQPQPANHRVRGLLRLQNGPLLAELKEASGKGPIVTLRELLLEKSTVDEQSMAMKKLGD